MKQPFKFSLPQAAIECALGSINSAATRYEQRGDQEKATRLRQHAGVIASLRDPEVVAHIERRNLRRVRAERQSA